MLQTGYIFLIFNRRVGFTKEKARGSRDEDFVFKNINAVNSSLC